MGYIAQDGEWFSSSDMKPNPVNKINHYVFLGVKYNTFEEMQAAVKVACKKLAKTIVK